MSTRVKISTKPGLVVELGIKVRGKHLADGAESPLKLLDWQIAGPIIDEATALHEKTESLRRELKEYYQKRKQKLVQVKEIIRDSRDILKGTHKKELKVLGQWGFEVLDTARPKADAIKAAVEKETAKS